MKKSSSRRRYKEEEDDNDDGEHSDSEDDEKSHWRKKQRHVPKISTSSIESASTIVSNINRICVRMTRNYLTGTRSAGFFVVASFLFVLFCAVLLIYGALVRSGIDASTTPDGIVLSSISGAASGTLVLVLGFLFVLIINFTKMTQSLPYEYALVVPMLWIIVSAYSRADCICCTPTSSSSSSDSSLHHTVSAAITSALTKSGACDEIPGLGMPAVALGLNIAFIIGITLLYATHQYTLDFSVVFTTMAKRAKSQQERQRYRDTIASVASKFRNKTGVAVAEEDIEVLATDLENGLSLDDGSAESYRADLSFGGAIADSPVRFAIATISMLVAFVPVGCNNAGLLEFFDYGIRIIAFLILFLLRISNDYNNRSVLVTLSSSMNLVKRDTVLFGMTQPDPTKPVNPQDLGAPAMEKMREKILAAMVRARWLPDLAISALAASTALVLCGWGLILVVIQFLYELVLVAIIRNLRANVTRALECSAREVTIGSRKQQNNKESGSYVSSTYPGRSHRHP